MGDDVTPERASVYANDLDEVFRHIDANIECERDFAAALATAYIRRRLPDLAVLYPRHRFGFHHMPTVSTSMVTIDPPLCKRYDRVLGAWRYGGWLKASRKVRFKPFPARYLVQHMDSLADQVCRHFGRTIPLIAPLGSTEAEQARLRPIIEKVRIVMSAEPQIILKRQVPWIGAGEHDKMQMLRDCGWI